MFELQSTLKRQQTAATKCILPWEVWCKHILVSLTKPTSLGRCGFRRTGGSMWRGGRSKDSPWNQPLKERRHLSCAKTSDTWKKQNKFPALSPRSHELLGVFSYGKRELREGQLLPGEKRLGKLQRRWVCSKKVPVTWQYSGVVNYLRTKIKDYI